MSLASINVRQHLGRRCPDVNKNLTELETVISSCKKMAQEIQQDAGKIMDIKQDVDVVPSEQGVAEQDFISIKQSSSERADDVISRESPAEASSEGDISELEQQEAMTVGESLPSSTFDNSLDVTEEVIGARVRPVFDFSCCQLPDPSSSTDINLNELEKQISEDVSTIPPNVGSDISISQTNLSQSLAASESLPPVATNDNGILCSDEEIDPMKHSQIEGKSSPTPSNHDLPPNDVSSLVNEPVQACTTATKAEESSSNSSAVTVLPQDPETSETSASCYSVSELLDSVPNDLPKTSPSRRPVNVSTLLDKHRRISAPQISTPSNSLQSEDSTEPFDVGLALRTYCRSQSDVTGTLDDANAGKGDGRQRKFSAVAKNVRNVLQFFKRRTSEANSPIPSVEVVESWSQNFNNLLNDKYGLMLFRNFLLSEYSEENIEFWIACEEYKKLKARQHAQKAQSIYSDFVTVHAPKEVNLDSKTRMETMKALANPTKVTFDLAQSRIQCLMEKDSYTRFLKSSSYTNVLTQARASSSSASTSTE